MLNIVIPMAGRGSRFANAGYDLPKPLIDVAGKPMIERVVDNVRPSQSHRFLFLCLEEHMRQYNLPQILESMAPGCQIIPVTEVTEGAACTVLLAKEWIDTEDPLMIANSDQLVDYGIDPYLQAGKGADGLIMTVWADAPNCSYLTADEQGRVTLVREKEPISNEATVGIYNFAKGSDFVRYAEEMIARDLRVKDEFYLAPVYNLLIEDGKIIFYHHIGKLGDGMYGLGTPEELEAFLQHPIANQLL